MERLVCPKCGEPIGDVAGIRWIIDALPNKELSGQCSCGEAYRIKLSLFGVVLSFPERRMSYAC